MLLNIRHASVAFSERVVLSDACFEIRDREKIAVVGRNGSGKTTLLRLIAKEIEFQPTEGTEDGGYSVTGEPVVGYLKQNSFSDLSLTMEQELRKELREIEKMKEELQRMTAALKTDHSEEAVLAYTTLEEEFKDRGGYYYEKEYETLIKKFGFSEEDKKKALSEFSGGQQTKIAFIRLLLKKPDVLLLDEPTNHLDLETIIWLERYLQNYEKAVVLVSHDRMFVDRIADVVYETEYGNLRRFPGNYTDYIRQKKELFERQKKEYDAQQKEIRRLTELIERFKAKPTKAAMARSKKKAIERMIRIDPPDFYDNRTFHAVFQPQSETGKDVLSVQELEIGYDHPLQKINLDLKKGEKLGIIGGNGIGKSTFLKTLVGDLDPLSGEIRFGVHANIGYFDQQLAQIRSDKTVLQEFWDSFPGLTETEARSALGAFLFTGEDVYKEISVLSGGEKVRLCLCRIFKNRPNILILDEPTNHMDISGKETLEAMLSAYEGTLIFVSHDRYFVKKVADRILLFESGKVTDYRFGYEEYEEKHLAEPEEEPKNRDKAVEKKKEDPRYGKERSRLEKKRTKTEKELSDAEAELDEIRKKLEDPLIQTDYEKLSELQKSEKEAEDALLSLYEVWDQLTEALEKVT